MDPSKSLKSISDYVIRHNSEAGRKVSADHVLHYHVCARNSKQNDNNYNNNNNNNNNNNQNNNLLTYIAQISTLLFSTAHCNLKENESNSK